MVTQALVSTVIMGLLVAAVAVGLSRASQGREGRAASDPYAEATDRLSSVGDDPAVLGAVFIVVALAAGLVTLATLGVFDLPEGMAGSLFGATLAVIGLVVAAFLFLGPYVLVREHGLGNALGIAAGVVGLGFAFLLLVATNLLFEFF